MRISEVKNMIIAFLDGEIDPYEFSFDLQDAICDNYENLAGEDEATAKKMDDIFPELCAEYENEDPAPFKQKIADACEKIFGPDWRQ